MKSRIITSVVYVAVWIALCALKWIVPGGWGSLGFDAAFCALSILGSLEFIRAVNGESGGTSINGEKTPGVKTISFAQKTVTVAFCAVIVPLYVIVQLITGSGMWAVVLCALVYAFVLSALNVFDHGVSTVRGTALSLLTMVYCGVLSCMLSAVNHLRVNSVPAILLLSLTTMLTDGLAFVVGSLFGRFVPFKLAPKVSPHKTVIGAVGGLLGGMLGAVLAYYIYVWLGGVFAYEGSLHPVVAFILVGLVASVLTQIGDLYESAVKRECGIKDMGKLLPGHGGVLDRFDGMLFCGVVVLVCFGMILA